MDRKFDLFISHVSGESDLATALQESIETDFTTLSVFVSSDNRSIGAGDWMGQVRKALADSKVVIVLCSPESIRRPWIAFEAGAGWLLPGVSLVLLCHSGMKTEELTSPYRSLQAVTVDSKGVAWLYEQIKNGFPEIKRAPPADRIQAAVVKLDWAVNIIINRRKLRERVNSVMGLTYRDGPRGREFLLVHTSSGGKWTFPKGTIQLGSDLSDYMELLRKELLDEAGVGGELFDTYFGPFKYMKDNGEERHVLGFPVRVEFTDQPRELFRRPRWCGVEEARTLLGEGRTANTASDLLKALDYIVNFKGKT